MNYSKKIAHSLLTLLIAGILTSPLILIIPSEGESAFWMGVSKGRLAIFTTHVLAVLVLGVILAIGARRNFTTPLFRRFGDFLNNPTYYATLRYTLLGLGIFLSFAFLNFLILIPQALSATSSWLTFSAWIIYAQFIKYVPTPVDFIPVKVTSPFPSLNTLSKTQKQTALVLLGVGLIYFCLFIPLNLKNSGSMNELNLDEMVMYPVIVKMLSSQPTIRMTLYHFIDYGAYIYGFPFFGWSAVLLLPAKIIFGPGYADHLQLNMLLLRQLINVFPSVLACFMFTYLTTHFKKLWASLLLLAVMLTLPGMTGLNNTFWHPDGINLLFIALALFYLDRDQQHFGANFYYAAIAIGFSAATRLFGLFFFLAIAGLLAAGLVKKTLSVRKALVTGVLFIVLMLGSILVANPYLFSPGEPKIALNSFTHQSETITQGWEEPDPEGIYRTGIDAWWPFMTRDYGSEVTLVFLAISVMIGVLGKNRKPFYSVLFAWLIVIGTYLIGFVMVKSPWYLLPLLIPLYCGAMAILDNLDCLSEKLRLSPLNMKVVKIVIMGLIAVLFVFQILQNLQILVPVFIAA